MHVNVMEWAEVAAVKDLEGAEMLKVSLGGLELAIFRLDDGYYATSNICTHQFAYLTEGYLEDGMVECPLHQALFDVKTGKAQGGLAKVDLATYRVRVDNDKVLVEIPSPAR